MTSQLHHSILLDTNLLDPMRFPLHGERLIEASAGTGKTFTLAALYLRLLLGHGPQLEDGQHAAHPRPLRVPEILVVTFTEAATEELRGRIRARIHEARLAFLAGSGKDDPLLAQLLAEVEDSALAARLLLDAERQMDEAAIFTIHGFCQRMLRQNAFESGALFSRELITDESLLRLQAVRDYWRNEFYGQSRSLIEVVAGLWNSPEALLAEIAGWFANGELTLLPESKTLSLAEYHQQQLARIESIRSGWLSQLDEIRRQTEGQVSRYTGKNYEGWLETISHWASAPQSGYQLAKPLERFGLALMQDNLKKGGKAPDLPLFAEIDALLADPPNLKPVVLTRAVSVLRERLAGSKRQDHLLSFDDLLSDLDLALRSPLGERLALRIRSQYPVAMIDEFQDTDPQQYRIFHHIYAGKPDTALLMIGDPKQAIYGFRGADIFTYIQARRNVADHYTLGRNFRSTQALVSAVNTLFARAQAPFIFDADIPFTPVDAQGKSKALLLEGHPLPAMHCWLQPGEPNVSKGSYQACMASATASEISRLLTLGQQGRLTIGEQPLTPGSIAVLVRTGAEGRLIQRELSRLGIASVYLSNRESVFAQQEARDLLLVLQACLEPDNERALRAALATALFDLDALRLDTLASDEMVWEATVLEFRAYHQIWQRKGVQAMVQSLMQQRELASILLGSPYGERRLTNLLHLAELLQQASMELDGEYGLLRWLSEAIAAPGEQQGEQILRLESERKLVQIVTIHKSKGLQYDLVFLPFICGFRPASQAFYHEAEQAWLDLAARPEAMERAERERLAEDLRLLYVALTRGVYATWLGLAPLKTGRGSGTDLHRSAIGYLLLGPEGGDGAALEQTLQDLHQGCDEIVLSPLPAGGAPFVAHEPERPEPQVRRFGALLQRNWWISSYSALAAHGSQERAHEQGVLAEPGFDAEVQPERGASPPLPVVEPARTIFTFPRGAQAGTLLHSLFEECDFRALHSSGAADEALQSRLASLLEQAGFEADWLPVLITQLQQVLATPLLEGFCLGQLAPEHKQVELEFLLPIHELKASRLSALIRQHDPLSARAGELQFATVQGMLKGFIDLVFCWQGRWYLLDYKSNHLGDTPQAYGQEALEQAMLAHRYDLQYQLYTLALHRLLRQRLPDYDPARHLGGVFYLFLRGMPEAGIFHSRPSVALVEALDRYFAGEEV